MPASNAAAASAADRTGRSTSRARRRASPRRGTGSLRAAFEPNEFPNKEGDYSLYASRNGPDGAIDTRPLLPPVYPYRELPNYEQARKRSHTFWTEPFFDKEGGNIWMLSHVTPFERDERFAGIANVDLSVRYFRRLRAWLTELQFGAGSYGFIISDAGTTFMIAWARCVP